MQIMKKILPVILLSLISCLGYAKTPALNYEQFGNLPMIQYPSVSPNGEHIAAIYNAPDGPSIVISAFGSAEVSTIVQLKKSQDRIEGISWVNSTRLLITASYSESIGNKRFRRDRIFSVDTDGTDLVELKTKMPPSAASWEKRRAASLSVVSLLKDDKKHVLLQTYDYRDEVQAVYKVNVYENDFDKLFVNKFNVHTWITNDKGQVLFGYGTEKSKKVTDVNTIWHRKNEQSEWELLHKQKAYSGETFTPVMVENDKLLVLTDYKTRRQALWSYDIQAGKFIEKLYGHDKYDIADVIYNPDRSRVIGVYYYDDYLRQHFFQNEDNNIALLVKNSFKGYQATVYSRSEDKTKMLVYATKDNSPQKFFWLDIKNKKGGLWFSTYPFLEGQPMPNVLPITFNADDGEEITGYLTLPVTADNNKKPPLVVWPHGGPIGIRDYQTFDPYVQFFASQGYAVLQVNYRGSGGFGTNFQASGHHEWGKRMQQDVYNGFDWLKSKNLVNTDKTCFAGYSYGGYAALTAAFQKPEQYSCVVSIAGISDLLTLAEKDYRWQGNLRAHIVNTIGDPTDESIAGELERLSATNNMDKIKAPILLMHGRYDTQVRVEQSADFYDKAKSAGLDVDYVEFKYGTHYLDEADNRLEAFKQLSEFLEEHLK
ncbi:S9 family peptidase [Cognaticolwellia beringensis]|uniref:S9 family peptidase n=2 Tax=Cognaticolwellia beringensis TaxID=1967665 RepID=A0A222G376_9GAMM|nr:S9 family peptidase [Cognaticolwellia beringensis]